MYIYIYIVCIYTSRSSSFLCFSIWNCCINGALLLHNFFSWGMHVWVCQHERFLASSFIFCLFRDRNAHRCGSRMRAHCRCTVHDTSAVPRHYVNKMHSHRQQQPEQRQQQKANKSMPIRCVRDGKKTRKNIPLRFWFYRFLLQHRLFVFNIYAYIH